MCPPLKDRRSCAAVAALMLLGLSCVNAATAAAWHAEGWPRRAVVEVAAGGTGDVAAVNVLHNGLVGPEANDLRVFDAAGRPVPYEVTYHNPAIDSWISFRAPAGQNTFFVYYGRSDAPRDPQRAIETPPGQGPPSAGPAAGGWIPRTGLVLTTLHRDRQSDNPRSVPQMLKLLKASPGPEGTAIRRTSPMR